MKKISFLLYFLLHVPTTIGTPPPELNLNFSYKKISFDPVLGHIYPKNSTLHSIDPDKTIAYKFNNYGFRDTDFLNMGSKNKILVFGSSTEFGLGIQAHERWSDLLEEKLKRDHYHITVYNLSRPGASLDLIEVLVSKYLKEINSTLAFILIDNILPLNEAFFLKPYYWEFTPKPFYKYDHKKQKLIFYKAGEYPLPTYFKISPDDNKVFSFLKKEFNKYSLKYFDNNILKLTESKAFLVASLLIKKINNHCQKAAIKCIYLYDDSEAKKVLDKQNLPSLNIFLKKKYQVNEYMKHLNLKGQRILSQRIFSYLIKKEYLNNP